MAKDAKSDFVLEEFDTDKNIFVQKMNVDPDLGSISSMDINQRGTFLLLGSSNRNIVGVIDVSSFSLVKKIDLPSKSHKISLL